MYYILHFIVAFMYIVPALYTDIFTATTYKTIDLVIIFVKPINLCIGILFGIIHFLINYLYLKRGKLNKKLAFYYPIAVMFTFCIAFVKNLTGNHLTIVHTNHPGFYVLMFSIILWGLIAYILCYCIFRVQLRDIVDETIFSFKHFFLKKSLLKVFEFIIIIITVTCTTEFFKNALFTIILWGLIAYILCYCIFRVKLRHIVDKTTFNFKHFFFKKSLLKVFVLIIIVFTVTCTTELLKNEIFTIKYGEQFEEIFPQIEMLGEEEYYKIIDYSDVKAEIYYVGKDMKYGDIVHFRCVENRWESPGYWTVWSATGSADEVIWPYWWH